MGLDAMIIVFWMSSFKPAFSLSSFNDWEVEVEENIMLKQRHKGWTEICQAKKEKKKREDASERKEGTPKG